jgi:hypothetical protein
VGSIDLIGVVSARSGRAEPISSVRTHGADRLDQRCMTRVGFDRRVRGAESYGC